jgi:hypothetical protein
MANTVGFMTGYFPSIRGEAGIEIASVSAGFI